MNCAEAPRFSDFAEADGPLQGRKERIDDILNKELLFLGFHVQESKYQRTNSKECLTVQYVPLDDPQDLRVFFTGSSVLLAQFQKYAAKLPFRAILKKVDKYFTLT